MCVSEFHDSVFGDIPVLMEDGVESHSIPPARGEVANVDIGVAVKDAKTETSVRTPLLEPLKFFSSVCGCTVKKLSKAIFSSCLT